MQRSLSHLVMAMAIALLPAMLPAQSIWVDRIHNKSFALEILKPSFKGEDNTTFITSALFLSLRYSIVEKVRVVAEVPFAHLGYDVGFGNTESENTFGNPHFGLEMQISNSPVFVEVGVRAPVAPDDDEENGSAAFVGAFSDFVDRVEAFAVDVVPINSMLNYRYKNPSGFVLRLRGGPSFWIPSGERDDSESFLLYSAQAGYESDKFSLLGGLTGRQWLSAGNVEYQTSFHQLAFAANIGLGNVRPGVYLQLPLYDALEDAPEVSAVFGLNLGIQLK